MPLPTVTIRASSIGAGGVAHLPATRAVHCCASKPRCDAAVAEIAEEVPVGFLYNGFSYAVMMATPGDLDDFAVGFSLAEGLIDDLRGLRAVSAHANVDGIELAIELAPDAFSRFLQRRRVRSLRGHTSCGICGVEEIAQLAAVSPPARQHAPHVPIDPDAVRRAVVVLRDFQPIGRMTRCAHAAAWADSDGRLAMVREDVGRHNALDKLVGACLRQSADTCCGFCLVTSRCSYEMVQKAIAARFPAIVAISAPTALAIRTARRAGLTLIALDRDRRPISYSGSLGAIERSAAQAVPASLHPDQNKHAAPG